MKIRYSLISLLVIIISAIAITAFIGTNTIKEQTNEIADRENPKVQAAIEMEVEINQITNSIFATMEQRPQRSQFEINIEDFQRFKEQYSALVETEIGGKQLEKLNTLFVEYESIGNQLIDTSTEKQNRVQERRDLFDGDIRETLLQKLKPGLNPADVDHDVKAEALNEIDINIQETISASRGYLLKPDVFLKDIVSEAISEIRYFTVQFDNTELTTDEKIQFELLKPDLNTLIVLTNEIIEFEDKRLELLEEFDSIRVQLDRVLDDEIQARTLQKIEEDAVKGRIQAALEMEVRVNDVANSIFAIMEQRPQISPIEKNIEGFQKFKEQYSALVETEIGKESVIKIDTLFVEYESIGNQLIEVHTEKQDRVQERRDLWNEDIRDTLLQKLKPGLNPADVDHDVKAEALNEIDINIHETISASRGYLLKPDEFLKDIVSEAISEIRYFTVQFDNTELTADEKIQFELLKPNLDTLIVLTNEILDFEDKRLELLEEFDSSLLQIDVVLDEEIQARTLQKIQGEENARIQAAIEMEVEIKQSSNAIFAIMEQRPQISPIEKNINQFQEFKEKYGSLIRTDIEKDQLKKLDTLFVEYESIGNQLIEVHTEKQDRVQERRDLWNEDIRDTLLQKLKPGLNQADVDHDVKAEALNEIDINIHETISASRGYLLKPDVFLKDIVLEAISELRHFTDVFDNTELTADERIQFELLKPDLEKLIVLTDEILEFEDNRLGLLDDFDSTLLQIDVVLDDEIQAIALQKIQEDEEKAKDAVNQLLISLIIIFAITLISGFVYSIRVGHRAEKLIEVTTEIEKGNYDTHASDKENDEIGILGKALNEMALKLKQSNLQQDEFAAMITHELKTPLVPIKGYCEMLLNPKFGEISQDQKEAIEEIYQNATQLESLIQNVLSAQKIGVQGMKYKYEDINVDEFIEKISKTLSPYMTEKKINFSQSVPSGLSIKADKSKLIEIFTNIVQNAVDFVPENDGKITINGKDQDKHVEFSITDNGIGMPKDKQKGLFQKFYQVDTSHTRKHGGSGLGLSICKGYVEDMGGKIWLESQEGKGTALFFTVPKTGNE